MSDVVSTALPTLPEISDWADAHGRDLGVRDLVIGAGAAARVRDIVARYAPAGNADIVVLIDDVPYRGLDGPFKQWLLDQLSSGERTVRPITAATGNTGLHADEETLARLQSAAAGAAVLVTIGSGTLVDIGKVLAERADMAHVVVQTAASVNGFSDDQSVVLVSGAKRTVPSRWPEALVVDIDVLCNAPLALNRAGLGDLLSMFTAPADWLLASTIGLGPTYDAGLVDLVHPNGPHLLQAAAAIGRNDPAAIDFLANLLSISGLTMGLAGATAPSSGAEHVISHLLEMHATSTGQRGALHGEQVGIASVVAAAIWARVRAVASTGLGRLVVPDLEAARASVFSTFQRLGEATAHECWSAYQRKLRFLHDNPASLNVLCTEWSRLSKQLDDLLVGPAELIAALRAAGASLAFSDIGDGFDTETVRWAVTNAHRMRDRFVVSDLAELMGLWTTEFIDDVLAELADLGGGL